MTFKTAMSNVGNGLLTGALAVTVAMNNGPLETRIAEIDEEIAKLQEEKTRLEDQLIK
jgi:uncharacterized small protein (DUF1192 family)